MQLIKSAKIYDVGLPAIARLREHLADLAFTPGPEGEAWALRYGFVPFSMADPVSGPMAMYFPGGVAFQFRVDEKILPEAVVKAKTDERATEVMKAQGLDAMPRKWRNEIRETVRINLLRAAFVRTRVVTAFYHYESRCLFVPANKAMADHLTAALVKAVGSVKPVTTHVSELKSGLTTRLASFINGADDAFGRFSPDGAVWLRGEAGRLVVQADDLDDVKEGLMHGLKVEAITLSRANGMPSFRLTQDFDLKSITGLQSDDVEELAEVGDLIEVWQHEASTQVGIMADCVRGLKEMFEYKEQEAA